MKPAHISRPLAVFFLILLAVAFLAGTVLSFGGVHAAPAATEAPDASPSATPEQAEGPASDNTAGILALGIILVAVILVGLLLGGRMARR